MLDPDLLPRGGRTPCPSVPAVLVSRCRCTNQHTPSCFMQLRLSLVEPWRSGVWGTGLQPFWGLQGTIVSSLGPAAWPATHITLTFPVATPTTI